MRPGSQGTRSPLLGMGSFNILPVLFMSSSLYSKRAQPSFHSRSYEPVYYSRLSFDARHPPPSPIASTTKHLSSPLLIMVDKSFLPEPLRDPNNCHSDPIDGFPYSYGYRPSLAAGIAFCVLFGIAFLGHGVQYIRRRRWTSITLAVGALSSFAPPSTPFAGYPAKERSVANSRAFAP